MSQPVRICSETLANGKTCRQPALKEEYVCRHHMRPFRHGMYDITHNEAMARLEASFRAMELPKLLLALQRKLNRIHRVVRAHPEANLALTVALERLACGDEASPSCPQTLPDFQSLLENFTESMR